MTRAHNCSQEEPMAPGQVITRWVNNSECFLPIFSTVWSPLASCWKVYWIDGTHRLQNVSQCRYLCNTWRRCLRVHNEFMSSWKHFFTGCHPQRMPPGWKMPTIWIWFGALDSKTITFGGWTAEYRYVEKHWVCVAHVVSKNCLVVVLCGALEAFSSIYKCLWHLLYVITITNSACFLSSSICLSETAQICI